ncbi:hypothetical protein [Rubrolithibacter danxiaensis]|uniref:hypothetical protein n=1 Tax=Rubrolithibacter danxiaensis TaxID=3390805 RepID=UPI003BF87D61
MNKNRSIAFTLFEGDYEYGVGVWINSLIDNAFVGRIVVGYRNALPFWINQLEKNEDNYYSIKRFSEIQLEFRRIDFNHHLRYYKPFLFEELLEEYPDANIYYFDPDITVIGDWQFFEEWIEYGVCLCLDDCYSIMPFSHPHKQKWLKLFPVNPENINYRYDYYINSGFVGANKNHESLIKEWKKFILHLISHSHNLKKFGPTQGRFKKSIRLEDIGGDQDILNAVLCANKTEVSLIGREGMGFIPGEYLMMHNTGIKTWRKNFLKEFIRKGIRVSSSDKSYLHYSFCPINIYPNRWTFRSKNLNKNLTLLLQRVF